MKKTVQIVTILLDKEGWSKGDLVDNGSLGYSLAPYDNKDGIDDWQAQQLLVLSDDEIKEGDWFYKPDMKMVFIAEYTPYKGCKKIIASYPHIQGTLPISKETVQAWIDAGTPEEGAIHEEIYMTSKNLSVDSQGNLLLEFAQPFKSTMPIYTVPSIPTDEEIREKALSALKKEREVDDGEQLSAFEGRCLTTGFYQGYKQALKDLGHADN